MRGGGQPARFLLSFESHRTLSTLGYGVTLKVAFGGRSLPGRDGGPPRLLTLETFDALCEYVRASKDFPVRPPGPYLPSLVPIKFDFGEEAGASSAFSWRWWEIPFSWTDEGGTPFASFPLPVAALHGPSVEGAQHLVSLTALFHVWPSSSNPHKFASERESERWDYWRSLGVTPGELLSSKRSVSCKRRRGRGWRFSGAALFLLHGHGHCASLVGHRCVSLYLRRPREDFAKSLALLLDARLQRVAPGNHDPVGTIGNLILTASTTPSISRCAMAASNRAS